MNTVRRILLLAALLIPVGLLRADSRPISERVAEEVEFLEIDSPRVRGRAAEELARFGPEARPAVKPLIRLLADDRPSTTGAFPPPVSFLAQQALFAIGSEAVESLISALGVQSADTRARSAIVLGRIGPKAAHALPALRITARDPEESVRFASVVAIGQIARSSETVESLLCECLRDQSVHVRVAAADALGSLANTSEQSEIGLLAALHDENPLVRSRAARALGRRRQSAETVVPALMPLLKDPGRSAVTVSICLEAQERVAISAADALREFGGRARPAGDLLLTALADPSDPILQQAAASAIAAQGDEARALLPKLRALLQRPGTESGVRQIVVGVYRQLGPLALGEVDDLRQLLLRPKPQTFSDVDLSLAAACALAVIDGPHNPEAWGLIFEELDRYVDLSQEEFQEFQPRSDLILQTLIQVGSIPARCAPALLKLFSRQDLERYPLDAHLVPLLATLGPAANPTADRLLAMLSKSRGDAKELVIAQLSVNPRRSANLQRMMSKTLDEETSLAILRALTAGKPLDAGPAVLLSRDERPRLRIAAAEILGRDDSTSKQTTPILVGMLTDDRPAVREQAARSLGVSQVTTGNVLPALVSALRDDYIDVRAAAADALGQLASTDESVVLALKTAIADPNPYVSDAAAKALAVIQPAPVK